MDGYGGVANKKRKISAGESPWVVFGDLYVMNLFVDFSDEGRISEAVRGV